MKEEPPIKRIRLSLKQMREEIKLKKGKLDESFSKEYLNETYLLSDGKVVVSFTSHGFLYNSMSDLKNWISYLKDKSVKPRHILEGKLLYGQNFSNHIPDLINSTIAICNLKNETPSLEQLKSIDKFINDNSTSLNFDSLFFSGIVAYVGEIIRKKFHGSVWTLIRSEVNQSVWEPYILFDNKRYDPFGPVYRELYEELPESNRISIYDRLLIELNR